MNQNPVATGTGRDLAAEFGQVRMLLEGELALVRAQVAAASEAEGLMRAQRDNLRHTQVLTEIRLMEMQKDLTAFVGKSGEREREWFEKLLSAAKELASMRLELGRVADQLAMAQAIGRNAQTEVVQYEAAQRAQIARLGELGSQVEYLESRVRELEPRVVYLEPRVAELEQQLQTLTEQLAKEKAAHDAQARELIRKRKETEARLTELAGARSRRILMKLRLVSRCAWEK